MAKPPPLAPIPPQNLDAEEAVLGALMIGSSRTVEAVSEFVAAEDFYRESHSKIYQAVLALHAISEPHDAIAVLEELVRRGQLEDVGGRQRIHELAALVPATANAPFHARTVHEKAQARGLIDVGGGIAQLGWDGEGAMPDLLDQAEGLLFGLTQLRAGSEFVSSADAVQEAYSRLVERYESGGKLVGLPTGLMDLDIVLQGLRPGNLIIVAARPSMGKSALALAVAANVAIRAELPVGLFTLEMSRAEVMDRLIGMEARVDSQRVTTGRVHADEWQRITEASDRIGRAPLHIDDSGALTALEVRSKARRLKLRHPGLSLLVVDYLQLMTSGERTDNRILDVAAISRQLKALAKDLEIPVLALSQLSRNTEQRHDKRPILSDLRESGALEQDADVVVFLYRDEYYHPEDTTEEGVAEVNVAKQRNGPTDTVKLSFVKRYALFSDLARMPGTGL